MRDYMLRNHESWYILAERLGYDVRREDVILVSGCVRASSWSGTAWSSGSTHHDAILSVSPCGPSGARFQFSHKEDTGFMPNTRYPSPPHSTQPGEPDRHCVFLNYYKLKHASSRLRYGVRTRALARDAAVVDDDVRDIRCCSWAKYSLRAQLDSIRASGEWISRFLCCSHKSQEMISSPRAPALGMIASQTVLFSQQQDREREKRGEDESNEDADVSKL